MKKILIFALAFLVVIFIGRQALVPKMVERGFARLVTASKMKAFLPAKTAMQGPLRLGSASGEPAPQM